MVRTSAVVLGLPPIVPCWWLTVITQHAHAARHDTRPPGAAHGSHSGQGAALQRCSSRRKGRGSCSYGEGGRGRVCHAIQGPTEVWSHYVVNTLPPLTLPHRPLCPGHAPKLTTLSALTWTWWIHCPRARIQTLTRWLSTLTAHSPLVSTRGCSRLTTIRYLAAHTERTASCPLVR